jgi:hypothetical protein
MGSSCVEELEGGVEPEATEDVESENELAEGVVGSDTGFAAEGGCERISVLLNAVAVGDAFTGIDGVGDAARMLGQQTSIWYKRIRTTLSLCFCHRTCLRSLPNLVF